MVPVRIQNRKKKNWQTLSDHRYQVLIPGVFFSGQVDSGGYNDQNHLCYLTIQVVLFFNR